MSLIFTVGSGYTVNGRDKIKYLLIRAIMRNLDVVHASSSRNRNLEF